MENCKRFDRMKSKKKNKTKAEVNESNEDIEFQINEKMKTT
jgi:hypothetical protein